MPKMEIVVAHLNRKQVTGGRVERMGKMQPLDAKPKINCKVISYRL